ncbi:MAG: class I SAM-dependent DNA methyltransferase [Solirubrobacterales bacterium]
MPEMESAEDAYDRSAAIYDEWNAQNDYEMWLGEVLLPELAKHGLRKGWALDVGCGTGRAFDPLLIRGWQIVGCDVSAGMLAEAERKFGSQIPLINVDARDLTPIRPSPGLPAERAFSLILLLNDVLNYMTEDGDLVRAFAGVRRNLNPEHGLVVFDANTLSLFRASFVAGVAEEMTARGWEWRGLTDEVRPGAVYEARLSGQGIEPHVHRERHWTDQQVREALEASGLRCLAALGMREEEGQILLSDPPDEERDYKVVYIAAYDA